MTFVWIVFIWAIFSIMYFGWKWIKEKKRIKNFEAKTKNYNKELMTMSISERLKKKHEVR